MQQCSTSVRQVVIGSSTVNRSKEIRRGIKKSKNKENQEKKVPERDMKVNSTGNKPSSNSLVPTNRSRQNMEREQRAMLDED